MHETLGSIPILKTKKTKNTMGGGGEIRKCNRGGEYNQRILYVEISQ
jgi:hypothetical protein